MHRQDAQQKKVPLAPARGFLFICWWETRSRFSWSHSRRVLMGETEPTRALRLVPPPRFKRRSAVPGEAVLPLHETRSLARRNRPETEPVYRSSLVNNGVRPCGHRSSTRSTISPAATTSPAWCGTSTVGFKGGPARCSLKNSFCSLKHSSSPTSATTLMVRRVSSAPRRTCR